jgi:hypothetical protein
LYDSRLYNEKIVAQNEKRRVANTYRLIFERRIKFCRARRSPGLLEIRKKAVRLFRE